MNVNLSHKQERRLQYNVSAVLPGVPILRTWADWCGGVNIKLNHEEVQLTYEHWKLIAELFQTENIWMSAYNDARFKEDPDKEVEQEILIVVENIPEGVLDSLC